MTITNNLPKWKIFAKTGSTLTTSKKDIIEQTLPLFWLAAATQILNFTKSRVFKNGDYCYLKSKPDVKAIAIDNQLYFNNVRLSSFSQFVRIALKKDSEKVSVEKHIGVSIISLDTNWIG